MHSPLNRSISSDSFAQDPDLEWKSRLQLKFHQPVHRNRGSTVDSEMRRKNIEKLKLAMYQSYNQQEGWLFNDFHIFNNVVDSGYLLAGEVVDLSLAFSTVYHLGLDQGGITGAVNTARSVDIRKGLVNIDTFIHCIEHYEIDK